MAYDPQVEQKFALAAAAELKGLFEHIRAQLGPTVHFGLLVEIPVEDGESRLIALTTDRERIARLAAGWITSSADPLGARGDPPGGG